MHKAYAIKAIVQGISPVRSDSLASRSFTLFRMTIPRSRHSEQSEETAATAGNPLVKFPAPASARRGIG
jgi:hypothetical protein